LAYKKKSPGEKGVGGCTPTISTAGEIFSKGHGAEDNGKGLVEIDDCLENETVKG